jgi:hypothetical protein
VLRTAGYALAHALGSVRLGGTLCTLAIIQSRDSFTLGRYEAPTIPVSVSIAIAHLTEELADGEWAALVYDGFVTIPGRDRTDAMMAEVILPGGVIAGRITQAYRPARRFGLPIVGQRLRAVGEPIADPALGGDRAIAAIEAGLLEHPDGARLLRQRQ